MKEDERKAEVRSALTYFALLGLGEDASQDEVEARYRELEEYLNSSRVPPALREWASQQAALVDEAYAVLADPERRTALRRSQPGAKAEAAAPATASPGAQKPPREREPARDRPSAPETGRPVRAERGGVPQAPARGAGRRREIIVDRLLSLRSQPLVLGVLLGLVVLVAILLAVYGLPGGGDGETPTGQGGDLATLDTERVAELMAAYQQNPNDPETLFELGENFFLAGQWQPAIDWFTELLAVDPNNVHARTDIGTANFNLGQFEEAKTAWLAALEIAPEDVQLHYNLGFLYANVEPPDLAAARQEWQKVVELAPESNLAQTAKVHLEGLAEASPTPVP